MGAVAIVDTSILCEILDIPGKNSKRAEIIQEFRQYVTQGTSFLLPMAAIYETGNHIAQLNDGRERRKYATQFIEEVKKAIDGERPWTVMQVPDREEIVAWLAFFPDSAMQGAGMADLSMVKEWEKQQKKVPGRRIFIWSLDKHLQGYDSGL